MHSQYYSRRALYYFDSMPTLRNSVFIVFTLSIRTRMPNTPYRNPSSVFQLVALRPLERRWTIKGVRETTRPVGRYENALSWANVQNKHQLRAAFSAWIGFRLDIDTSNGDPWNDFPLPCLCLQTNEYTMLQLRPRRSTVRLLAGLHCIRSRHLACKLFKLAILLTPTIYRTGQFCSLSCERPSLCFADPMLRPNNSLGCVSYRANVIRPRSGLFVCMTTSRTCFIVVAKKKMTENEWK